MANNNNEFFGVEEKYIPKTENNDKEDIKKDEKNIYELENNDETYIKKDKKKVYIILIVLLVAFPLIIFTIITSIVGFSIFNLGKSLTSGIEESRITYTQEPEIFHDQQYEMFNSKFTAYEGKQRGAAVKALITAVTSNNSTGVRQVKLKGVTSVTDVISQKNYNVKMNYDSEGYVNEIVITEAE